MSGAAAEIATLVTQKEERTALNFIWSSLGSSPELKAQGWGSSVTLPCAVLNPWQSLTCSLDRRVTAIDFSLLPPMSLSGAIPWAAMGALEQLSSFVAPRQHIGGTLLPADSPTFSQLTTLDLRYCQVSSLTGDITRLPALQQLRLRNNTISSLPGGIGQLHALQQLDLFANQLAGLLPEGFSKLTALSLLDLGLNSISGQGLSLLPPLSKLVYLGAKGNKLSGSLPSQLANLRNLTSLDLAFNAIGGGIPASWTSMATLEYLQLSGNKLTGYFPEAATRLSTLTKLDISRNSFYGAVPPPFWTTSISDVDISINFFNGSVPSVRSDSVKFEDNCFTQVGVNTSLTLSSTQKTTQTCSAFYTELYPVPPAPTSSSSNTGLIVGIVAGAVALVLVVAALLFIRKRRRDKIAKRLRKGTTQSTREFSLGELKAATDNWATVVGKGGYGTVYKATLKDGAKVAVKRLDQVSDQGDQEFIREVELLSRVHHRHLVNLVGFCGEKGERALVYEYMGLGSLYDHLHGECSKEQPLTWDSRIKIAIHVAFGIDYLHYGADPPLIHRDIKSGNILLSEDGYAKVADFGLCKEAPVGVSVDGTAQLVPPATEVRGSFGYLDPEYVNTSVLSEKSDVYSYGVVLLELITGKKSIHDWQPLAYWAEPYLEDPKKLPELVDPALEGQYDVHELQVLCDIARSCVYDQASRRPAIRDVAQALVENLGGFAASSTSDGIMERSTISSTSDPTEATTSCGTPSEYSFRNATSEALLVGLLRSNGEVKSSDSYVLSMGPDGTKPPVPVGKRQDTM